jgi:three-Cys-motif partner protein
MVACRGNKHLHVPRLRTMDLPVRSTGVGPWTVDKLEIIWRYLPAFAKACQRAPSFHFIDGFSGPGVNGIEGERVAGSPLLALEASPRFPSCLFMEHNDVTREALRKRTTAYKRARVQKGNCNTDLIPAMRDVLGEWDPALVLLDPEGTELAWTTVASIAGFKTRRTRLEQLILLATHTGFLRMLREDGTVPDWAAERMTYMYGNEKWRDIHRRRARKEIDTDRATTEYVSLYGDGLRALGYKHVLDREIRDRGFRGKLRYFLIFATEHEVGYKIMDHIFNTVTSSPPEPQGTLFKPERRRRIQE